MKGIILAGGSGTRLYPLTKAVSKQMLPIYDKPMIYYPLAILMQSNIRDILIISTPRDIGSYEELLGDGSRFGISLSFKIQTKPKGIADAFIVGKQFIGNSSVALILGDNVFYGEKLNSILQKVVKRKKGATIFGYGVKDPTHYGVVEFDNKSNAVSIEEKPKNPKSNFAVPGLYFYDNNVISVAENIEPSNRNELEITDVNRVYMDQNKLKVEILEEGISWFDTGTYQGLLNAANFVETIQKEQRIYIACIEEIAYKKGYINKHQLQKLAESMIKTEYGQYLKNILER
ncbi:glucose-1-phosphate thymidylyltransferase RfbA [Vallitalea sp.]|jgi:glucose-1-phosphate thymidylyltransferase|uniref:glucose-1-phosphate thymidylyltransferase RfbA n=1 Tax=Vallitalea sp. TaxID=1882829 RepID=UPI0025F00C6C|nr:glucose-1-phosphate thymidylyltransferase RfbA [Vallitalea sp.]MCT4686660.1 glucose-1-phosphate thymidylyltransferase RfbA [Vallitalea sp.]